MREGWKVVVLDDDPTGMQTVHGNWMITRWNEENISIALEDSVPFFYVLTNSRAETPRRVGSMIEEIVKRIFSVNQRFGYKLPFISRSDSTLRSHFPLEVETICQVIEQSEGGAPDAFFVAPQYFECGRITYGGTHYLSEGGVDTPTSETEFATDSVFPYETSFLPDYIQAKSDGRIAADSVKSVSVDLLDGNHDASLDVLLKSLDGREAVVVNAVSYAQMNVFCQAVWRSVAEGKRFTFYSAASFVKSFAGVPDRPLLGKEIISKPGAGAVFIGSHVKRTSDQLNELLKNDAVEGIEVDVRLISEGRLRLKSILDRMRAAVESNKTPIIYTSREEIVDMDPDARQALGKQVSDCLVLIAKQLPFTPQFCHRKGRYHFASGFGGRNGSRPGSCRRPDCSGSIRYNAA